MNKNLKFVPICIIRKNSKNSKIFKIRKMRTLEQCDVTQHTTPQFRRHLRKNTTRF